MPLGFRTVKGGRRLDGNSPILHRNNEDLLLKQSLEYDQRVANYGMSRLFLLDNPVDFRIMKMNIPNGPIVS